MFGDGRMANECWMCNAVVVFEGGELTKHCPECGVENDIINQATKEETVPIIESKGLSPFFKKGMLTEGAVGKILTAFTPQGKFLNQTGEVDFEGQVIKVSLNGTSLRDIASAYGINTDNWVGKQIVYSVEDIENKKTNALFRGCNVFRAFR